MSETAQSFRTARRKLGSALVRYFAAYLRSWALSMLKWAHSIDGETTFKGYDI